MQRDPGTPEKSSGIPDNNLPVPASEGEVTSEWLRAALSGAFPAAALASLKSERIGEAYGFASLILRCSWQDAGRPQSVVVKLWDTDSPAGSGEVLFYRGFPQVGARVPACFYSAVDAGRHRAVLVLEDLKDAEQGDVLDLLDIQRAKGVARNLARLHAAWLDHPGLAELAWVRDVSTWEREGEWFDSRRSLFLERFPHHLHGTARRLLDKIELAPQVTNRRLQAAPLCLLHGDFHLDNLLFEGESEPVFLDWSHPLKGAPAFNLVSLLFFMTTLENFDALLDGYLDELNRRVSQPVSRSELGRQIGGELLRAFATGTCGAARWQPPPGRGEQMLDRSIRQVNAAVGFWQARDAELFAFLA